jgi:hypothetical protein
MDDQGFSFYLSFLVVCKWKTGEKAGSVGIFISYINPVLADAGGGGWL